MNARTHLLAGLVLGSALMLGCEERPEARPAPDRTTTPRTTTPDYGDTTTTTTTTTTAQTRAQTLIMEVRQHINAGRFDDAEIGLVELEGMKSSLPQTTQTEITQLRTQLRQKQSGTDTSTTPPTSPNTPPSTPPSIPPDR